MAAASDIASTGKHVRSAFIWETVSFGIAQVAGAGVFLLMSRNLSPAIFGAFASAVLVVDFLAQQGKSAASDAILQRRDLSPTNLSTVCATFLLLCVATALAATLLAGPLADFVGSPLIRSIVPLLAATMLLLPPILVMEALILSELGYKTLAMRSIAGVLLGGLLGVLTLFTPLHDFALVVQRITQSVVTLGFLFLQTRWLPSFEFSRAKAGVFLRSFVPLWGTQLLNVGPGKLTDLIVGWSLGPAALGVLRVSGKFLEMLYGPIVNPIMAMWVPIMGRMANDPERRRAFFLRLIGIAAMVCSPILFGLGLIGTDLAAILLSPSYSEVGTLLIFFGIVGLYLPFTFFRGSILAATGRNAQALLIAVLDLAITCSTAFVSAPYGLVAMSLATTISALPVAALTSWVVCRAVGVEVRRFLYAIAPAYAGIAVMTIVVVVTRDFIWTAPPLVRLVATVAVGGVSYAGCLLLLFRRWTLENFRFLASRAEDDTTLAETVEQLERTAPATA